MTHRRSPVAAFALLVGLASGGASLHAWIGSNHLAYLTFSGPVALPGVSLPAGTYAFEVANLDGGADVVIVRNRARTMQYYMGMTRTVTRPRGAAPTHSVSFGEARRGEPTPIVAWYPPESPVGRQFLYPR